MKRSVHARGVEPLRASSLGVVLLVVVCASTSSPGRVFTTASAQEVGGRETSTGRQRAARPPLPKCPLTGEARKAANEASTLPRPAPPAKASPESLTLWAEQLNDARYYDWAVCAATEALNYEKKHAPAYLVRGDAFSNKLDFVQAVFDYSLALKYDPQSAHAYNNRGFAYFNLALKNNSRQSDYAQAVRDYTEAIKRDPRYAHAYNNRGRVYFNTGKYLQAVKDYDEAIRLDPLYANAYSNRAEAHAKLGRKGLAAADSRKARELTQTQPPPAPAPELRR